MSNNIMKRMIAITTIAGALISPTAWTATGSVQVDITFPPLIILYYFDDIDVTVDADDLESLILNGNAALASCTPGAGTSAELECVAAESPKALSSGSVTGSTVSYDADIAGDTVVSPVVDGTVTVVLENSWAVRALASSLTADVALSGSGDFTNSIITPVNPTPSLTLTDGDNIGDVQFDVDLDGLSPILTASDTLTITVVSP